MFTLKLHSTLYSRLISRKNPLLCKITLILLGTLAIACSAQVSIPFKPVPLTMQSTTVLLLGAMYGTELSAMTVVFYLMAGACGLPIFANFSTGLSTMLGPNAGYLLAFLPASVTCGYLIEHGWGKNAVSSFLASTIGCIIIFTGGVAWLSSFIGCKQALIVGVLPFVVTEPLKLIIVALIIPKCWKAKH